MHIPLIVIINPKDGADYEAAQAAVWHLIDPYYAEREVEPYEDDCGFCEDLEVPDPECKECHGTGRWITTANPLGEWDWWQMGGRYTGALVTDYDPESDPANKEVCPFCIGPEKRCEPEDCTNCDGTGIAVAWPTDWRPFNRDVLPVPFVRTDFVPFAVLTPDGKWQDVDDFEGEAAAWECEFRAAMATYHDCLAVIVDYHI